MNYRPEYRHEGVGGPVGATGRSPLHQFILDTTEGNPFFMGEIVQELREQGMRSCDAGGTARA
ncbi:MAG TPA: hypothetical protein VNN62_15115 [Methylomirabilota bacterium]|nr:hypothetical protein [Methylomirabilota bacterium]